MDSDPAAPHQIAATAPSVLIVDPDFLARWQAADYLRERGYNIIEATGVSDAIGLLASGVHIEMVFSDLHSPDASDSSLFAEWLEKHHPSLPLLMATKAHVAGTTPTPGRTHRVIAEPYELDQLAGQIDSILKGS